MGLFRPKLPRDYAEQTYASPYWLIRYPHRRRYELALAAVAEAAPERLLDYGAGDGHLLVQLGRAPFAPPAIVAYEPVPEVASLARAMLAAPSGAGTVRVIESLSELDGQRFEMIVCLGVLEHLPLAERRRAYDAWERLLAPGGRCLIDVPVEIGLTLAVKEFGRAALKGRRPLYSARALLRAVAGIVTDDPQRQDPAVESTWIHDHIGFDHRSLARELSDRFTVLERYGSPIRRLPAALGNQEVFYLLGARALSK